MVKSSPDSTVGVGDVWVSGTLVFTPDIKGELKGVAVAAVGADEVYTGNSVPVAFDFSES
ncbi:MAG: hypothetical protein CL718_00275 [Chloroflexi bacterium]|nr:hypothetical protein [Chloroflexota bacterium]